MSWYKPEDQASQDEIKNKKRSESDGSTAVDGFTSKASSISSSSTLGIKPTIRTFSSSINFKSDPNNQRTSRGSLRGSFGSLLRPSFMHLPERMDSFHVRRSKSKSLIRGVNSISFDQFEPTSIAEYKRLKYFQNHARELYHAHSIMSMHLLGSKSGIYDKHCLFVSITGISIRLKLGERRSEVPGTTPILLWRCGKNRIPSTRPASISFSIGNLRSKLEVHTRNTVGSQVSSFLSDTEKFSLSSSMASQHKRVLESQATGLYNQFCKIDPQETVEPKLNFIWDQMGLDLKPLSESCPSLYQILTKSKTKTAPITAKRESIPIKKNAPMLGTHSQSSPFLENGMQEKAPQRIPVIPLDEIKPVKDETRVLKDMGSDTAITEEKSTGSLLSKINRMGSRWKNILPGKLRRSTPQDEIKPIPLKEEKKYPENTEPSSVQKPKIKGVGIPKRESKNQEDQITVSEQEEEDNRVSRINIERKPSLFLSKERRLSSPQSRPKVHFEESSDDESWHTPPKSLPDKRLSPHAQPKDLHDNHGGLPKKRPSEDHHEISRPLLDDPLKQSDHLSPGKDQRQSQSRIGSADKSVSKKDITEKERDKQQRSPFDDTSITKPTAESERRHQPANKSTVEKPISSIKGSHKESDTSLNDANKHVSPTQKKDNFGSKNKFVDKNPEDEGRKIHPLDDGKSPSSHFKTDDTRRHSSTGLRLSSEKNLVEDHRQISDLKSYTMDKRQSSTQSPQQSRSDRVSSRGEDEDIKLATTPIGKEEFPPDYIHKQTSLKPNSKEKPPQAQSHQQTRSDHVISRREDEDIKRAATPRSREEFSPDSNVVQLSSEKDRGKDHRQISDLKSYSPDKRQSSTQSHQQSRSDRVSSRGEDEDIKLATTSIGKEEFPPDYIHKQTSLKPNSKEKPPQAQSHQQTRSDHVISRREDEDIKRAATPRSKEEFSPDSNVVQLSSEKDRGKDHRQISTFKSYSPDKRQSSTQSHQQSRSDRVSSRKEGEDIQLAVTSRSKEEFPPHYIHKQTSAKPTSKEETPHGDKRKRETEMTSPDKDELPSSSSLHRESVISPKHEGVSREYSQVQVPAKLKKEEADPPISSQMPLSSKFEGFQPAHVKNQAPIKPEPKKGITQVQEKIQAPVSPKIKDESSQKDIRIQRERKEVDEKAQSSAKKVKEATKDSYVQGKELPSIHQGRAAKDSLRKKPVSQKNSVFDTGLYTDKSKLDTASGISSEHHSLDTEYYSLDTENHSTDTLYCSVPSLRSSDYKYSMPSRVPSDYKSTLPSRIPSDYKSVLPSRVPSDCKSLQPSRVTSDRDYKLDPSTQSNPVNDYHKRHERPTSSPEDLFYDCLTYDEPTSNVRHQGVTPGSDIKRQSPVRKFATRITSSIRKVTSWIVAKATRRRYSADTELEDFHSVGEPSDTESCYQSPK